MELPDNGESALTAAATAECCDLEDGVSFLTLRQVAAEFMRQHADDFAPFLTQVSSCLYLTTFNYQLYDLLDCYI